MLLRGLSLSVDQISIMISLLLVTHFIGDFLLQSDKMAINKSKNTVEGRNGWPSIVGCIVYASYG